MAIQANLVRQQDFSAGQLDPEMARSDDRELQRAGAKAMENCSILSPRGFGRRPGAERLYTAGHPIDLVEPVPGTMFEFAFAAGEVRFYNGSSLVQVLTNFPWGAAIVEELDWVTFGRFVVVVHQSHVPQVIEYNATSRSWSRRNFAFRQIFGNTERQPFFRFAGFGATMGVDRRSGTGVTVTFSQDVLDPNHAGTLFRYSGRQIRITRVVSARTATADVLDELPPTHTMTTTGADTNAGFRIGEIVEGDTSNATGQVVALNGTNQILVALTKNFNGFRANETVVGPSSTTRIRADSTETAPHPVTEWDEAFMSNFRGWPGSVAYDRSRLIFSRFKQAPHCHRVVRDRCVR